MRPLAFATVLRTMDVNRRLLLGVSAAGAAGAFAAATDAARAATLASTLGRDVTPYGRRPGSPLEGGGIPLPARRGLVHCIGGRDVRVIDCEITGSGGNAIWLEQVSGDISGNILTKTAATAVVSFDAQGLIVSRNIISGTN